MRVWPSVHESNITLSPAERRRLEALVRDRNTAQKYVWRAEIVLLSVEGMWRDGTDFIWSAKEAAA